MYADVRERGPSADIATVFPDLRAAFTLVARTAPFLRTLEWSPAEEAGRFAPSETGGSTSFAGLAAAGTAVLAACFSDIK